VKSALLHSHDGWISITQDHYLTITAHYIVEGQMYVMVPNRTGGTGQRKSKEEEMEQK